MLIERFLIGKNRFVDHTTFEPGKALPFPPLYVQIFFEHIVADDNGPGIPIGTQAHVHTKNKPCSFNIRQCRNNLFSQTFKKFGIGKFPSRIRTSRSGLATPLLVIDKNQVNIGTDVKFLAAQLTHSHHKQVLRHTTFRAGNAKSLR